MKIVEWSRKVSEIAGVILVLACLGCSDDAAKEPVPEPALPKDLAMMQGTWVSVATNACAGNCGATFEGYTIRLRYQETEDAPLIRQSASIERVDEQKKELFIYGGIGAWPYLYGTGDGEELVELEFFSQHHKDWRQMHMRRAKG